MVTNNDLPAAVRAEYRLTSDLKGGPVFDIPALQLYRLCFTAAPPAYYTRRVAIITPAIAERLVRAGWPGIERIPPRNAWEEKAPAPPKNRRNQPETDLSAEAEATADGGE